MSPQILALGIPLIRALSLTSSGTGFLTFTEAQPVTMTTESLPAERVGSGSPLEGGDNFGKAPLGLFIHHQILSPVGLSRSFLARECTCVWFLHPTLLYLHNILWPKNAGRIHAFVLKPYDGLIRHFCLSEIRLQKLCCTLVEHLRTYGRGLASSALPTVPLLVGDTNRAISHQLDSGIFHIMSSYDTLGQIRYGIYIMCSKILCGVNRKFRCHSTIDMLICCA